MRAGSCSMLGFMRSIASRVRGVVSRHQLIHQPQAILVAGRTNTSNPDVWDRRREGQFSMLLLMAGSGHKWSKTTSPTWPTICVGLEVFGDEKSGYDGKQQAWIYEKCTDAQVWSCQISCTGQTKRFPMKQHSNSQVL